MLNPKPFEYKELTYFIVIIVIFVLGLNIIFVFIIISCTSILFEFGLFICDSSMCQFIVYQQYKVFVLRIYQ